MRKIVLFTVFAVLVGFASCSKKETEVAQTPSNQTPQEATIDFRFNLLEDDGNAYFNWSAEGKNIQDSFDAAAGASTGKSTKEFDVVRYDSTGKAKAIPGGLRYLMLFPIANRSVAQGDNLNVTDNGGVLTIRWIHRGNAFEVTTDANGKLGMSGFKMAAGVGENVDGKFLLKDEFVVEGGDKANMTDADWSKFELVPDTADANATYTYDGTLDCAFTDGVLTIKGSILKNVR